MTLHHYGTQINPAMFTETPDVNNPTNPPTRPVAGTPVLVRDAVTGNDLASFTTTDYGYWTYSVDEVGLIICSTDNWVTTLGPFASMEMQQSWVDGVTTADTALTTANNNALAIAALQINGTGGGGQILTEESGGYPAKQAGSAIWVGKDKPPIADGYASGNDLYFQTTSI